MKNEIKTFGGEFDKFLNKCYTYIVLSLSDSGNSILKIFSLDNLLFLNVLIYEFFISVLFISKFTFLFFLIIKVCRSYY